jgi:RNA recognition motif-containing protein
MAFHRIHFLANETPSSKSLNHFNDIFQTNHHLGLCLMKLRVSPISAAITKATLLEAFEVYGEVDTVQILRGAKQSIALIEMPQAKEAEEALDALDHSEIQDQHIRVEYWHDHINKRQSTDTITLDKDEEEKEEVEEVDMADFDEDMEEE